MAGGAWSAIAMDTEAGGIGLHGDASEAIGVAAAGVAAAAQMQNRVRRGGRIRRREVVDSGSDRSSSEDTEDSGDEDEQEAQKEKEEGEEDRVRDRGFCTNCCQTEKVWAAADDEKWAGDNMDEATKKRGMVFTFLNPRRLCKVDGEAEEAKMWSKMKKLRADVVGLSDVGTVSEASMGSNKVIGRQWKESSGKAAKKAKKWGGDLMKWTHSEGIEMDRGTEGSKLTEGGVHVGVLERWRHRVVNFIEDNRGWGRFSGFVLR